MRLDRQLDAFIPEPDVNLPCTVELGELREQELQCTLYALIRILLDPVAAHFHVTSRYTQEESATPRLLAQRFLRALSEQ